MQANVLLIEDDHDLLTLYESALGHYGYSVAKAGNAAEALEHLRRETFDAIVLDLVLPDATGAEVLRAARRDAPDTPVVVTTGFGSLESALECLRAGAFDYLRKPVPLEAFQAAIQRAVERRRLHRTKGLYELSLGILDASRREELPQLIVETAMKIMEADDASLMLLDDKERLCVAFSSGLDSEVQSHVVLELGERVAGRAAVEGKPILIDGDVDQDDRFSGLERKDDRAHSSIVFPLVRDGRLLGVLNLNRSKGRRPFRNIDLQDASLLASQAVLAIENARLVKKLTASERLAALGQLASGIAHEINNPLAGTRLSLQEIARTVLMSADRGEPLRITDDLREAVEAALDGASRLSQIVDDMRAASRGGGDERRLFDLNEAVGVAFRVARSTLERVAVAERVIEEGLPVRASLSQLSQVIVNLLVNAAQAIEAEKGSRGRVVITTKRVGDKVTVEVCDDGPGIAPGDLQRIFDPFFTTKPDGVGTGVGLALSREIARRFDGDLQVESQQGLGAAFRLTLPAADAAMPALDLPTRRRILIVDDDHTLLRIFERVLSRRFEVTVARTGREAMELLLRDRDFVLIISDLLMPEMTGMELFEVVTDLVPELKDRFLFVTAFSDDSSVKDFGLRAARPVLRKPRDESSLERFADLLDA